MELRQIQTFVAVTQTKSFTKAAEYLGYSQSAVTVQIRLLENELNTRLFDRMGKGIELTAQGRQFLDYADTIIKEINRAKNFMSLEKSFTRPSISGRWSPSAFLNFRRYCIISGNIIQKCPCRSRPRPRRN